MAGISFLDLMRTEALASGLAREGQANRETASGQLLPRSTRSERLAADSDGVQEGEHGDRGGDHGRQERELQAGTVSLCGNGARV